MSLDGRFEINFEAATGVRGREREGERACARLGERERGGERAWESEHDECWVSALLRFSPPPRSRQMMLLLQPHSRLSGLCAVSAALLRSLCGGIQTTKLRPDAALLHLRRRAMRCVFPCASTSLLAGRCDPSMLNICAF